MNTEKKHNRFPYARLSFQFRVKSIRIGSIESQMIPNILTGPFNASNEGSNYFNSTIKRVNVLACNFIVDRLENHQQ